MTNVLTMAATTVPALVWMGFIFWLSSLGGDTIGEKVALDKVALDIDQSLLEILVPLGSLLAHVALFFALGLAVLFAARKGGRAGVVGSSVLALTVTFGYGVLDEFHQLFVPGRDASLQDVWADMSGGVMSVGVFIVWKKSPIFRLALQGKPRKSTVDQRK